MRNLPTTFAFLAIMLGCSDEPRSILALRYSGYTNIHVSSEVPLMACNGDAYRSAFTAINPAGTEARGYVCCGIVHACKVVF